MFHFQNLVTFSEAFHPPTISAQSSQHISQPSETFSPAELPSPTLANSALLYSVEVITATVLVEFSPSILRVSPVFYVFELSCYCCDFDRSS